MTKVDINAEIIKNVATNLGLEISDKQCKHFWGTSNRIRIKAPFHLYFAIDDDCFKVLSNIGICLQVQISNPDYEMMVRHAIVCLIVSKMGIVGYITLKGAEIERLKELIISMKLAVKMSKLHTYKKAFKWVELAVEQIPNTFSSPLIIVS